ncbi:UDP-N-acetylmuramate dehydrogenase [Neisseriaceae bacterium TC5R-5]|nr:UDP-N-acetylmuramate dehydrogenase [Neisseriaceae bacterium TC5R-5]
MSLILHENQSLKPCNSFGIAATARYFCELSQHQQIAHLLNSSAYQNGPTLYLGAGSNVLFTQDFAGLVVRMALRGIRLLAQDEQYVWVEAAAGENWHDFVQYALAQGWYGLENLSLIPGTVGASPIQNIGAYGVEVKDYISEVVCADLQQAGQQRLVRAQDCHFGYRDSIFKRPVSQSLLITAVRFRLLRQAQLRTTYGDIQQELDASGIRQPTPQDVSLAVMRIRSRKLPNPAKLGNAGSFFKNPIIPQQQAAALLQQYPQLPHYPAGPEQVKLAAGWLIDQCGLKGYRSGDAGVHQQQALVLVNYGQASGRQIQALADKIRTTVQQRFGVTLEAEPLQL